MKLADHDIRVCYAKSDESVYVFTYRPDRWAEVIQTLSRYASDPALGFTWYDAAVVGQRVRAMQKEAAR